MIGLSTNFWSGENRFLFIVPVYSFLYFPSTCRTVVNLSGNGNDAVLELRNFGFRPTGISGAMDLGASIISQGGWDHDKDVITVRRVARCVNNQFFPPYTSCDAYSSLLTN